MGDENKEVSVETLQQQLAVLQSKLEERESKISELTDMVDVEKREAFKRRDEAKEAERKALEEQNKFQELYVKVKKEFSDYKEQYSEEKYNGIQKQLDAIVTAQKNRLLDQIPEEDRELFKDLDIPKLEKIVEKLGGNVVGVDATAGRSAAPVTKDWSSMTEKEKLDLTAADPAKAKSLMVEAMKK